MTDQEIIDEVNSWIGTKWMHGVALKGYRTDCVQFIVSIAKKFNWIPVKYETPKYSKDYALHNDNDILLKEIAKFGTKIEGKDFQVGDVLIFKYGRVPHHAGIYIGDNQIVHANNTEGVRKVDLNTMMKRFNSAWRLKHE